MKAKRVNRKAAKPKTKDGNPPLKGGPVEKDSRPEGAGERPDYGGLPDVDLRKNLGCG